MPSSKTKKAFLNLYNIANPRQYAALGSYVYLIVYKLGKKWCICSANCYKIYKNNIFIGFTTSYESTTDYRIGSNCYWRGKFFGGILHTVCQLPQVFRQRN